MSSSFLSTSLFNNITSSWELELCPFISFVFSRDPLQGWGCGKLKMLWGWEGGGGGRGGRQPTLALSGTPSLYLMGVETSASGPLWGGKAKSCFFEVRSALNWQVTVVSPGVSSGEKPGWICEGWGCLQKTLSLLHCSPKTRFPRRLHVRPTWSNTGPLSAGVWILRPPWCFPDLLRRFTSQPGRPYAARCCPLQAVEGHSLHLRVRRLCAWAQSSTEWWLFITSSCQSS